MAEHKIGEALVTTMLHESINCKIRKGALVKVIDYDSSKGYTIEDGKGNKIKGIGFII